MNFKFNATYGTLTKYVDQLVDGFLPSTIGKVRTLDYISIVPDVKFSKVITTLDSTINFSDASSCATFSSNSTSSMNGTTITTAFIKAEDKICLNEMEQYWLGKYMRPGSNQTTIPFEQSFMDEKMGKIAAKLDQTYWQGNAGLGITSAYAQISASGEAVKVTSQFTSSATMIAAVDTFLAAIPSAVASEELVLFVDQAAFDLYTRAVRDANYYTFSPDEINGGAVRVFGKRNVTMVATVGATSGRGVLCNPNFLFWGTDLAPSEEPIAAQYDFVQDALLLRYKVKIGSAAAFKSTFVINY